MVRAWHGVLGGATHDIEVELRLFGLTINGEHLIMKQGLHEGDVKLLSDP